MLTQQNMVRVDDRIAGNTLHPCVICQPRRELPFVTVVIRRRARSPVEKLDVRGDHGRRIGVGIACGGRVNGATSPRGSTVGYDASNGYAVLRKRNQESLASGGRRLFHRIDLSFIESTSAPKTEMLQFLGRPRFRHSVQ